MDSNMTNSATSVVHFHSLHRESNPSPRTTPHSGGPRKRVIVERVACSPRKPPLYPQGASQMAPRRHLSAHRSIKSRGCELPTTGRVVSSGSHTTDVSREVVQEVHRDTSKEIPTSPLCPGHARLTHQSGCPADCVKAKSRKDTMGRVRGYEWGESRIESAVGAPRRDEGQGHLEEESLIRLSAWKAETELRNRREQETEQDVREFERSGVYAREQHQRPRYRTAARAWNSSRGLLDVVDVNEPPFGVRDRLHISGRTTRKSHRWCSEEFGRGAR